MRTFHIGGAAKRQREASTLENRAPGKVVYENIEVVTRPADGDENREQMLR